MVQALPFSWQWSPYSALTQVQLTQLYPMLLLDCLTSVKTLCLIELMLLN